MRVHTFVIRQFRSVMIYIKLLPDAKQLNFHRIFPPIDPTYIVCEWLEIVRARDTRSFIFITSPFLFFRTYVHSDHHFFLFKDKKKLERAFLSICLRKKENERKKKK